MPSALFKQTEYLTATDIILIPNHYFYKNILIGNKRISHKKYRQSVSDADDDNRVPTFINIQA